MKCFSGELFDRALGNPLRWNCEIQGCFNRQKRPKIEVFKNCFPGRIALSDVDGMAEMSSNGTLLEWKPAPIELSFGQSLAYHNLTKSKQLIVICVAGDAETMEVSHMGEWYGGKWSGWRQANLFDVQYTFYKWAVSNGRYSHTWPPTELTRALVNRRGRDEDCERQHRRLFKLNEPSEQWGRLCSEKHGVERDTRPGQMPD